MKKLLTALIALCAFSAHAGLVTYTTRAAYDAAVSTSTTVDFEAQGTNGSVAYYGSSLTAGGVQFADNQSRLFVFSGGFYGDHFSSHYLNNNSMGTEITITFAAPVHAFAMDLGVISNWGGAAQLRDLINFGGNTVAFDFIGQQSSGAPLQFVGFSSDEAFSSITINDFTQGLAIDNFSYSTDAIGAVPEPASLALVGLALATVGFARARRR